MINIPLSYRLLRLNASNDNLLDVYHTLYHELDGEERTGLVTRINFRKRFELELHNCLNKKKISKTEESVFKRLSMLCFEWLSRSEFALQNKFSAADRKLCYHLEKDNKKIYYNILHSQMLSPAVTDLLLKQKKEVEGHLLKEI